MPNYNTYIGARYVPIFADPIEWDKSKSYEPLTIVTYQGDSYTSKTFVPSQTEITNTEFWARTGSYNAQVEQYRKETQEVVTQLDDLEESVNNSINQFDTRLTQTETKINSYETRVTALETDNTTNKSNISSNTSKITSLESNVQTINTEIESLDSKIESLDDNVNNINENISNLESFVKNKSYIVIGDSYTDGPNSWDKRLKTNLGATDDNFKLSARGGAGFAHGSPNFLTLLQEVSVPDQNSITHIIVCGGANNYGKDINTILTGAGGIQQFVNYAKTNYPNAKVYIGFIGVDINQWNGISRALEAYKRCTEYGAIYLNNTEYILPSMSLLQSDGIHPNDTGDQWLGDYITNAVLSGSCDVNYGYELLTINKNPIFDTFTGGFATYRQNNTQRLVSTIFNIEFTANPQTITADGNSKIDIGTFNNGSFIGFAFATTTVNAIVLTNNEGFKNMEMTLEVDKNTIKASFYSADKDGVSWWTGTIQRIYFNQINLISAIF